MRRYEIRGYLAPAGKGQIKFEQMVIAVDRSSAVRLVTAQYTMPEGKVYISDVKDHGAVKN
jgi:hypothetical protein